MVGLKTPIYCADNTWKLAKDLRKDDLIINTRGAPVPILNIETVHEAAVSIKVDTAHFNIMFGACTPIIVDNKKDFYSDKPDKEYIYACDCKGKINLTADYVKLGSYYAGDDAYPLGYVCSQWNSEWNSSRYPFYSSVLSLDSIAQISVKNFDVHKFRFNNSNISFHRGFADGLKDKYFNLGCEYEYSSQLATLDIVLSYNLGDKSVIWDDKLNYNGYSVRSSCMTKVDSHPLLGKCELLYIESEDGFIASRFKVCDR